MARKIPNKQRLAEECARLRSRMRHICSYSGPESDGGRERAMLRGAIVALQWALNGQERGEPCRLLFAHLHADTLSADKEQR